MPKHKIYLGKIRNASPMMEMLAKRPAGEKERPMQVKFDGEWKAMLHLDYPLASVWARMLDYLQRNNRPVYVEIDNDTDIITKLYIPIVTKVLEIISSDENVIYYIFIGSHARHHLRRNLPDFQKFSDALQEAKDTGTNILVTAISHEFEIIDVRPVPPSFGNDGPSEPPPPPPPDPPITPQRATDLFNMMNAGSCTPCSSASPCIPFKYPVDGCWIRAHLMCYLMTAEGETPEKIWIKGNLVVPTSNVHNCEVGWGWHVAPTLMVSQTSGPDIKMVIDPSLCPGPVTTSDWKGLQGDPAATMYSTSWQDHYWDDVYSGTVYEAFATQAEANNKMEEYRLYLDELCAYYGPSPYACPIVKSCFFIVDRSTISNDEIDAMLVISNPAVIEAALYVVVDGFTPSELGITATTLSGIPNIRPALTPTPSVSQMTIEVMATIKLEDTVHLNRRQRITWKYKISFTGSAGFVNNLEEINLDASISTVSGNGKIYLVKQQNPYEIDGEVSWLSTDLRVFQIKTGDSLFNKQMAADAPNFITDVIQNLNTGNTGGQTFENNISTDQQTSKLELSQSVGGVGVYNFAVAKVRYRSLSATASNVRVFFRLFPASSTSLEYNQSTTYSRDTSGGVVRPLLGIINGEAVTIPCFASPRIDSSMASMIMQTDIPNVQPIPPDATGNEVVRYFGCWLDINQTQPQFPFNPSPVTGPWSSGRQSVQEHVRNEHQCLVAEIAFDPTPIPLSAYPSTSDKLAQRNLAIVQSANPGDFASHRIPHTFEIKPTRTRRSSGNELPDELMIDWENIPLDCLATIYISGVNTNDILSLAAKTYRSHRLVRVDANTLQCETGGMTYIPIPAGEGSNFPALLSIDLPAGVKKGQVFTVVVHQVTSSVKSEILTHATVGHRRILGSFQITIPVTIKENMLMHEEILLSNLRWIQQAIPENNRWFPVFNRYVKQIVNRVDALGGDSDKVAASPSDDWKIRYKRCLILRIIATVLLAVFVIVSGSLSGQALIIAGSLALALLLLVTYYWIRNCKPGKCSLLKTVLFGVGSGAIVLALLFLFGVSASQLIEILVASISVTALTALICWKLHCFK